MCLGEPGRLDYDASNPVRLALSSKLSSLSQKMSRLALGDASFTAGGTETLSVSREAGHGRKGSNVVAFG